jgi:hypothetical protein
VIAGISLNEKPTLRSGFFAFWATIRWGRALLYTDRIVSYEGLVAFDSGVAYFPTGIGPLANIYRDDWKSANAAP